MGWGLRLTVNVHQSCLPWARARARRLQDWNLFEALAGSPM